MTLQAHLQWRSNDRSMFWNNRMKTRVDKGIFTGGLLTTVSGQLQIKVGGDVGAVSYDGMVVWDLDLLQTTLAVTPGITQHVLLRAKWVNNTLPVLQYEVLQDTVYNGDADKDYLIILGSFTLGGGATEVLPADIDYTQRDEIDIVSRNSFRGSVAVLADLPTGTPNTNKDGDIYLVRSTQKQYRWDALTTSWEDALGTSSIHIATGISEYASTIHKTRLLEKSGVLTDMYGDYATNPTEEGTFRGHVLIDDGQKSTANTVLISDLDVLVHGHFLTIPYSVITMSAPPVGTRWDGVFLEVWREEILDPNALRFAPATGFSKTFEEMQSIYEEVDNRATFSGNSVEVYSVESVGKNKWVATFWQIRTVDSLAATAYQSGDGLMLDLATDNLDGNPWAVPSSIANPSYQDNGLYYSPYATAYDDVSWGIPLWVVRRTATEDWTTNQAIMWKRTDDGMQQMFEVFPRVQTGIDRYHNRSQQNSTAFDGDNVYGGGNDLWAEQYRVASGILQGYQGPILGKTSAGALAVDTVRMPTMVVSILGRKLYVPMYDLDLGVAPSVAGGGQKQLVVLTLSYCRYPADGNVYDLTGQVPLSWKVTNENGDLFFACLRYQSAVLSSNDIWDMFSAVSDSSWDWVSANTDRSNTDTGLLYRTGAADTLFENPLGDLFAVPIALVHRRNDQAFSRNVNFNGGSGRPDGYTHDCIEKDDILDLRRRVVTDSGDMAEILSESMERLSQGRLRTSMLPHPLKSGAAGTVHLYEDVLNNGSGLPIPVTGYQEHPAIVDGCRTVWSDAEEYEVLSEEFQVAVWGAGFIYQSPRWSYVGPGSHVISFRWDGAIDGYLTLEAPINSHFEMYDVLPSQPVWANGGVFRINTTDITAISNINSGILYGWSVVASDSRGNPIKIECRVSTPALIFTAISQYYLSVVVRYPRPSAVPDPDNYQRNIGTFGNQDKLVDVRTNNYGYAQGKVKPPVGWIQKVVPGGTPTAVSYTLAELATAAGVGSLDFVGLPTTYKPEVFVSQGEVLDSLLVQPKFNVPPYAHTNFTNSYQIDMDDGTGILNIDFGLAAAGDTSELIFQYADDGGTPADDVWWEMGKATKSFHGMYSWAKAEVALPVGYLAGDILYLGPDQFATNGGVDLTGAFFHRGYSNIDFYVWYETAPGIWRMLNANEFTAKMNFPDGVNTLLVNYGNLLPVDLLVGVGGPGTNIRVWAKMWVPPERDDWVYLSYLGTPYNGLCFQDVDPTNAEMADSHFFGEVKETSNVTISSKGPGTTRFSGVRTNPQLPMILPQDIQLYRGINPALIYLPKLGCPTWRDFDFPDSGCSYLHTPQYNWRDAYDTDSPWEVGNTFLEWLDITNEQKLSEVDFQTTVPRTSDCSFSTADTLRSGLLIRRPDGYDPSEVQIGVVSNHWSMTLGFAQGLFHRSQTDVAGSPEYLLVRNITSPVGDDSDFYLNWLSSQGLSQFTVGGKLIGLSEDFDVQHIQQVRVGIPFTRLQNSPSIMTVGYLLKSQSDSVTPRINRAGNLYMILFTDLSISNPDAPGCAFDSFFPLYYPVLPLDPESDSF